MDSEKKFEIFPRREDDEEAGGGDSLSVVSSGNSCKKRIDAVNSMVYDFLRTRPEHIKDKRGHSGREITCLTNYIPVVTKPDWTLYQYHVSFHPAVDSKAARNRMVHDHSSMLGEELIFDGLILYLPFDLPEREVTLESLHPRNGSRVQLTVRRTNELLPGDPQCITLFNLCNRKAFQLKNFRQLGRHFFDPSHSAVIEKHRIEIWPGFISAIRSQEEDLLMCCEMSHKVLRIDTVLDFMYDLYRKSREEGRFKETATQILVGTSVLTRYNNKTYRIDDIIWDKHPSETFQTGDGRTLTLAEYYMQQYSRVIKDPNQPLLVSLLSSSLLLSLLRDLCTDESSQEEGGCGTRGGLQSGRVSHSGALCHDGIDGGHEKRQTSHARPRSVHQSPSGTAHHPRSELSQESHRFQGDPAALRQVVSVSGRGRGLRESPGPSSGGSHRGRRQGLQLQSGSGRLGQGVRLTEGVSLTHWVFVFPEADKPKAEEFFRTIRDIGAKIGMPVEKPEIVSLSSDRTSTYLEAIRFGRESEPKAQMVVCMVPNDNKTRYDAIKKLCCLDEPVPSQVIRSQTLSKNVISVCTKVILQMNCKLGGSLWRVHIPMKTAMVVAYDAYHDSANRGKSVGAAVFSLDAGLTRWYSQCALHGESRELIGNLTQFCENGLKKYYEVNGFLPDRIFLYRDGCGDGQIPVVYSQELPQLQRAFRNIGQTMCLDYAPKLTFTIVTKRVNTRFFEARGDSILNPPPGTVVDSVVTRKERYDFFLVPQCVRQGTVTPVSYNVIFDSSGLTPDQQQRLAYKLCHLYYNWQGTIRVPAPCQYAHKLAFLVGQSLHRPPHHLLADKLFFL